ncbi:VOC family protein [Streptomyces sp. NPDC050509]|uniref:VOC family protein n=1 Tax=Streptomyces sp. NPDC050509 TaxID=3365620 RepID=UPI003793AB20
MDIDLLVIYSDELDACRAFYAGLGLTFAKERHGAGPEHYAAELDGTIFELYPSSARRPATGSLRLGLTLPAGAGATPGRHTLTDPDGRTVVLTVQEQT